MQEDKLREILEKVLATPTWQKNIVRIPERKITNKAIQQIKQYARDEWVLNTKQINYALKRVRFNEESILLDSVKDSERVILCGSVRKRLAKAIHTKMRERIK